jgi:phospholipid/cholesterol/gamma-HCH transport system ATP-binding protein
MKRDPWPVAVTGREPAVASPTQAPGGHVDAVEFERVSMAFDGNVVLRDLSFSVPAGHMTILIGASGVGKSVVLKLILGLLKPDSGVIRVNGERIDSMTETKLLRVRDDIGMLFQESALFDSLTVADNVGYKLYEETDMPADQVRRRVEEVLRFIGLEEYIDRMPSELSGGQRRRVAIARAVAARPRLLLFDEPTSGLDPITAKTVDAEIIKLRDVQHVTSILVTHQLQDAFYVATHQAVSRNGQLAIVMADKHTAEEATFLMLKEGQVYFKGTAAGLRASTDPLLRTFLSDWSLRSSHNRADILQRSGRCHRI